MLSYLILTVLLFSLGDVVAQSEKGGYYCLEGFYDQNRDALCNDQLELSINFSSAKSDLIVFQNERFWCPFVWGSPTTIRNPTAIKIELPCGQKPAFISLRRNNNPDCSPLSPPTLYNGSTTLKPMHLRDEKYTSGSTESRVTFKMDTAACDNKYCKEGTTLSGAAWAREFRDTGTLEKLEDTFEANVRRFINALSEAGISRSIFSTFRPPQRSYMMRWSYLIYKNQYALDKDPKIPDYTFPRALKGTGGDTPESKLPLNICWYHTDEAGNLSIGKSKTAAKELLAALGVDPRLTTAPAFPSKHNYGNAIDMDVRWTGEKRLRAANGTLVRLASTPKHSLNPSLWRVAATYNVIHFGTGPTGGNPAADRNHWSNNGR